MRATSRSPRALDLIHRGLTSVGIKQLTLSRNTRIPSGNLSSNASVLSSLRHHDGAPAVTPPVQLDEQRGVHPGMRRTKQNRSRA
ncbi:MAG: hypothetical protein KDK91_00045 [Gammaproteobacteria bacterium]|nr:hypothetical protein [Gammaproteobacteria bacterium]